MLLIKCPWCGERDQTEFSAHGEAHITRPLDSASMSDAEWGNYLFFRNNTRGLQHERWMHVFGCRRWFNVARDTLSDQIFATCKPGEPPPVSESQDGQGQP